MSPDPIETSRPRAEPETVAALLRQRLEAAPDALAFRFLTDTRGTSVSLTYAELDRRARAVAGHLRRENLADRPVLLLHPPGLDYIAAFFGCVYAGALAVPAYPPANGRFGQTMARLAAVAHDSGATHALTTREVLDAAQAKPRELAGAGLDRLHWTASEELEAGPDDAYTDPGTNGDSLAFLQYTSGSTARPKGVMVTHGNLLSNLRSIHQRLGHGPDSQMVSWLPPYHDMGLIGAILTPLYGGFPAHLMAPMTFVQRPMLWLETLSSTKATTSAAPNFGFEQCVRRVTPQQRDGLDLRHWKLALNGAEPVRADTLDAFAEYFAPAGFDRAALLPCYGLAEATLMVTGIEPHEEPETTAFSSRALRSGTAEEAGDDAGHTTRVVGCGTPVPEVRVAVVDPRTRRRVTGRRIGEVWIAGPNVAHGYWGQPEATEQTFGARIEDEPGAVWMRTGDLGFQRDGRLYLTGRSKDVVIVQGRNLYPHDIELTAEKADATIRSGNGAAFGVPTPDGEALALVYETGGRAVSDPARVLARLRTAIAEEHEAAPHTIALVRHSTIPKTTSGKIQRQGTRTGFLDLAMTVVAASVVQDTPDPAPDAPGRDGRPPADRARVAEELARAVAETLGQRPDGSADKIAAGCDLAELGLDYPALLRVVRTMERRLGRALPVGDLLVRPHTETLIGLCLDEEPGAGTDAPRDTAPVPSPAPGTYGEAPLRGLAEATGPAPAAAEIQEWLTERVARRLGLPPAVIDIDQPFASLGLDSKQAVAIAAELAARIGAVPQAQLVFEHPTIRRAAAHLATRSGAAAAAPAAAARPVPAAGEPIAIIGMGCRFPGAPDVDSYWRLLLDGRDAVGDVPVDRWDPATVNAPGQGGFLDRVDEFDARFFGIAAREAERMDPQQRLLLEIAWQTLEDAGLPPARLAGGDTGVFVGVSGQDYANLQMANPDAVDVYSATGNAHAIAANRLSYFFDLRGPSLAVDTACSSSLVAVHMACQSLRAGECRTALAGGVSLQITPALSAAFANGRMLGPSGRCRAFDDAADGYVRGEGAGLVCLKPLSAALADGDRVHAVIRGSATGHGGRSNGLTAPRSSAQRAVILDAMAQAGLESGQIGYVEAHGTGTSLGDPIEWAALADTYGQREAGAEPCLVGSAKTNIGHLEAAAGIAGLIKSALVVRYREVPPLLHLTTPNRRLEQNGPGLALATRRRELPAGTARAGVSSFGFGGANAHVIIEAGPEPEAEDKPVNTPPRAHALCLSGHTPTSLTELAHQYRTHLAAHPDVPLASLCHSANTGRAHLPHRAVLVASGPGELDAALDALAGGQASGAVVQGHTAGAPAPTTAFLFSGQGTQYAGMGGALYRAHPEFARTVDRAAEVLRPLLDVPLTDLLFEAGADERLRRTRYCQPALVALEVALARLWMSLGVRPTAVLGHSVGALSAACVAGVLTLEDALTLAVRRAELMDGQPGDGAMIACVGDPALVRSAAETAQVAVAAVNTPTHLVLSGEADRVAALREDLERRGVTVRPLTVSHAFHSPMMTGASEGVREEAGRIGFAEPGTTWISDATGEPAGRVDADYWARHMLGTVRFADGFAALRRLGCDAFVEIGPHPTLLNLGRSMTAAGAAPGPERGREPLWLPSLRRRGNEWETLLQSLGRLHCAGGEVDWSALAPGEPPARVPVPHTVFERELYWFTPPAVGAAASAVPAPPAAAPAVPVSAPQTVAPQGVVPGWPQPPAGYPVPQPVPGMPPGYYPPAPYGMPYLVPAGYYPPYGMPPGAMPGMPPAPGYGMPGWGWPAAPVPPAAGAPGPAGAEGGAAFEEQVRQAVLEGLSRVCGFRVEQIPAHARIGADLGLDSLMRTDLQRRITTRFPTEAERLRHGLPEDPTVRDLVERLAGTGPGAAAQPTAQPTAAPVPAPVAVPDAGDAVATEVVQEYEFEQWEEYEQLRGRLRQAGSHGDNPYGRVHEGFNSGQATLGGRKVVNFAAFNYLALSNHPRVRQAAKDAIDQYGTGSSATPLLFGETPLHHELEAEIASFLGTEAAIVFAGGHATNVATVGHLFGPEDLVVHDEWIHDSTVRGCILSGARRRPFPHNDWEALERILAGARSSHRRALVVIEGAYSQDGDIPELPRFVEVKKRHRAMLMIDEAHSIGVLGRTGRGVGEHFGTDPADVDLWMGTLSKAIGSLGGYIAARGPIIEYLKYTAPLHIFSTGISPANTAAALEAFRVIRDEPERVARVRELSDFFRAQARARGLDIGVSRASAVIPVIVGDWDKTMALSNSLLEQGVNVMPIGYPAVAADKCRLRFFINADHSEADLERSLDLLV